MLQRTPPVSDTDRQRQCRPHHMVVVVQHLPREVAVAARLEVAEVSRRARGPPCPRSAAVGADEKVEKKNLHSNRMNKYVYTQATGVRRALRLTDRDPSWYDVSGPDPRCTTLQINQHCQSW